MTKNHVHESHVQQKPIWKRLNNIKIITFGGIVIIAALLFLSQVVFGSGTASTNASASQSVRVDYVYDYQPSKVVSNDGLFGIHEMGPARNPIHYLPAGGPQPDLQIHHDFWDFGEVGANEVATHTFALENVGDAPLTIGRIYTTCGCTTAELSAQEIPSGKVAMLRLIFDAGFHDVRGQQVRRGVIIENNDPDFSQAEVWTAAEVGWQ